MARSKRKRPKQKPTAVEAPVQTATVVHHDERFTVVDGVLSPEEHDLVWNFFQAQEFRSIESLGAIQHWSLLDGGVRRAPTVAWGTASGDVSFPTGTPADLFIEAMLANAEAFEGNVGLPERDWDGLTATPMLYPAGTGLVWHRDSERYTGSYTYYAHREWNIEWGGELMLHAQHDFPRETGVFFHRLQRVGAEPPAAVTSHLDNADANETLMAHGIGSFVMPKPNRLVVVHGGTPHGVARVSPAAGGQVRASISGFFRRAGVD